MAHPRQAQVHDFAKPVGMPCIKAKGYLPLNKVVHEFQTVAQFIYRILKCEQGTPDSSKNDWIRAIAGACETEDEAWLLVGEF